MRVCKFCKMELKTAEEIYYNSCDKCYYGMRLDPQDWLKWLREECGQDAVYRGGCIPTAHGIGCREPYVPADEYDPKKEMRKLDKFFEFSREVSNGRNKKSRDSSE